MACYLQQNSGEEPPATNFCYERKTVLIFDVKPKPRALSAGLSHCPSQGKLSGPPPHTQGRRRVLGRAGPCRSRGRGPSLSPPQLSATGRKVGRGPARLSAQSQPERGGQTRTQARRTPRRAEQVGALTQQQHVLPRGEFGARAGGDLAEDAGPGGEQGSRSGRGPAPEGLPRPPRPDGGGRERGGLGRAPSPGGHATLDHPRAGVGGGDQGGVRSLPKVLSVLVVACRGAAVARR